MQVLKVIGRKVQIMPGAGVIALTKQQAGARLHALTPRGKDEYSIRQPVEFKCGEVFGFTGEINKALMALVEEPRHVPPPVADMVIVEKPVGKMEINPIADLEERKPHTKR